MSSNLSQKIRSLRDSEGLGRKVFSEKLGISQRTLEGIENKGSDPASSVLQNLCRIYPQYTFWLTVGKVEPEIGQVSPESVESPVSIREAIISVLESAESTGTLLTPEQTADLILEQLNTRKDDRVEDKSVI